MLENNSLTINMHVFTLTLLLRVPHSHGINEQHLIENNITFPNDSIDEYC